ncbi:hypothetical protein NQ318_022274 [Aromia moschata]|uniref:Uncharacterized protein n=1 Tax=Aromia moschata TaxID=1265417 RepID=A0AAV8Z6E7_9CUCU|nr:hypothetical protein NQ318_022274 [Aromia moschata]
MLKQKKLFTKKKGKLDNNQKPENIEDWAKYKKEKKELRLKRRQGKNNFDLITKAKKMGEELRRKTLKGGEENEHN